MNQDLKDLEAREDQGVDISHPPVKTDYFALSCLLARTEGATVLKNAALRNMREDDDGERLNAEARAESRAERQRHLDDLATYGRRSS